MKVSIIGAGFVGSTTAYAVAQRASATDVVLVDRRPAKAQAEAEDIMHAVPFGGSVRVHAGDYDDTAGSDIVVLAAGPSIVPGQSRLDLVKGNAEVFREVVPAVHQRSPNAILLVATNPVDVLTHVAAALADLPPTRVIGSGTILDTARFRTNLAAHLGIAPVSVHGYVLGEHGDSEVLAWSSARIGGLPLLAVAAELGRPLTPDVQARIDEDVRRAGYRILEGKGFTAFGIATGLARIIEAIRDDERLVTTVSMRTARLGDVEDVAISLQRVIGREGVVHSLAPDLSPSEMAALERSASVVRAATAAVCY
jgi:L-lactate dehydrogenase